MARAVVQLAGGEDAGGDGDLFLAVTVDIGSNRRCRALGDEFLCRSVVDDETRHADRPVRHRRAVRAEREDVTDAQRLDAAAEREAVLRLHDDVGHRRAFEVGHARRDVDLLVVDDGVTRRWFQSGAINAYGPTGHDRPVWSPRMHIAVPSCLYDVELLLR